MAKNGVFVMGHHTQEHLYLADKYTPENKKVPFGDVSLMLEPPHVKALTDNGHFSSCFDQDVIFPNGASIKMPLIWQKTL